MIHQRMTESAIDASLDAYLNGAQEGDLHQARRMHEMLDSMLTERETPGGRMWLTDHGRTLLADMHRKLSQCESGGDDLRETVMDTVGFRPHESHWNDTCSFIHDLRVATAMANELCRQRDAGGEPDVHLAALTVSELEEFELNPTQVREIYDEIATTVRGFREISNR